MSPCSVSSVDAVMGLVRGMVISMTLIVLPVVVCLEWSQLPRFAPLHLHITTEMMLISSASNCVLQIYAHCTDVA
jgi:hypothetical protein